MKKPLKPYTKELIINSFDLESPTTLSESELEKILAERVEYLLANRLEFFFAAMYRMDIQEAKIHQVLNSNQARPALAIARLIIQRQKEKQASREKYRSETDFFDDSLD
ncbi:MAG TPA: hypothetical protein ENK85_12045 [Saprospiraceae bacterium]|nr:hypothetical protein [Saprospiraceae bacterium]